jgi:hypothetical protein
MKLLKLSLIIMSVYGSAILFTGCKKQDSPESVKEQQILKITGDIDADSLRANVTWLQNMQTRFALAGNRRNVAYSIMNRFTAMGFTDTEIDSFIISKLYGGVTYELMEYNVIATLGGSSSSDSVCIIGAHYDDITGSGDPFTIAPGANDNASGVAATLEVARVLMKNNFTPSTSIRFVAFASEEQGLFGSNNYTVKIYNAGDKVRFMLNNDMIAYETEPNQTMWYVDIMDYSNSTCLRKEAEDLCFKYSVLKPYNDNTYSHASDSYMFFVRNYKAIFFFAHTIDPNYHTVNDLVSNCNFDYCREIVKVNCAMLVNKN